jgi:hypothetical protein
MQDRGIEIASAERMSEFRPIFNGVDLSGWQMSTIRNQPGRDDPGRFEVLDGSLVTRPGSDLGLLWFTEPAPTDFHLQLDWRVTARTDNSGIFFRFLHPETWGYNNSAWVAIDTGFELQIDELARPDGRPTHLTGAIYKFQGPMNPDALPAAEVGEWNRFDLEIRGQRYLVTLNGTLINDYEFEPGIDERFPERGLEPTPENPRYIGLQAHTGEVWFRNIRLRAL